MIICLCSGLSQLVLYTLSNRDNVSFRLWDHEVVFGQYGSPEDCAVLL